MSTSLTIAIEGEAFAKSQLKKVVSKVGEENLGKAIMAGAYILEGAAKVEAPVDTGALRNSIHSKLISTSLTSAEAEIVADVLYALFVELGTYRQKANPYMRRAINGNAPAIANAVIETLRRFIAEVRE